MNFNEWWHNIGSGLSLPGADMEEQSEFVSRAAWMAAMENNPQVKQIEANTLITNQEKNNEY